MNSLKTKKLLPILTFASVGLFSLLEGTEQSLQASPLASQAQLQAAQLAQYQLQAGIAPGHSISLHSLWSH
jgi:hypothetical protein